MRLRYTLILLVCAAVVSPTFALAKGGGGFSGGGRSGGGFGGGRSSGFSGSGSRSTGFSRPASSPSFSKPSPSTFGGSKQNSFKAGNTPSSFGGTNASKGSGIKSPTSTFGDSSKQQSFKAGNTNSAFGGTSAVKNVPTENSNTHEGAKRTGFTSSQVNSSVEKVPVPDEGSKSVFSGTKETPVPEKKSGFVSSSTQRPGAAPSKAGSDVDKALAERVAMSGGTYASRAEAEAAFKKENAEKLSPKFKEEPKQRPDYVPSQVSVDGISVPVSYNRQYGGYGYMRNGSWEFYDAMRDMVMLDLLLNRHHYSYGPPVSAVSYQPPVVYDSGSASSVGAGFFAGVMIIVVLVVAAILVVATARSMER